MSNPLRIIARKLGAGHLAQFLRAKLPLLLFHILEYFRGSKSDRQEIRINGKAAIYDVFFCQGNNYIAVIGNYSAFDKPGVITCTFNSGVISKAKLIDDFSHPYEGEQVLVCLFEVPDADKHAGVTSVSLRSLDSVWQCEVPERPAPLKKHYLSVAAIMKDEDRNLREWIEYYKVLGVDHFYIYDNRSLKRNKIRRILQPYIEQSVVTLFDWDYPFAFDEKNTWRFCQRGQTHHCLYKYGELNSWILFIDLDEFVYPVDPTQMSLLPLLTEYDKQPEVAALQFKMMWFGNSGYRKVPPGLIIENYTHRDVAVVPKGREKVCVKPAQVELLLNHDVKKCVDGTEKVVVPPEDYRINHYFATSVSRKHKYESRFNEVEDDGMKKFVI